MFVVLNVFRPDVAGGAAVYTDLCFSLSRDGFDVTVAAPVPFFPEWRDKTGRNGWRVWRYSESGAAIERYGLFIPRNPNSLVQRLLFEGTFFLSLLRALPGMRRADVILAFCPLAAGVAVGAVARRLFGTPLILNVQDITADAASTAGIARAPLVARVLRGVERFLFNQADHWTTISPVMVRHLETLRRRGQPVDYLPNWVGLSLAREVESVRGVRDGHPHDPIRLLYAGNIARKQNLVAFCTALQSSRLNFTLRICGDGAAAADVAQWVARIADRRFSFEPILTEPEFARALAWSDYYVITELPGAGGSFVPSKLIPGLMSGTPILAVCDAESPLGQEIRGHEPGLHMRWGEVGDVGARIAAVKRPMYAAWAANAAQRAAHYDRERLIGQVEKLLESETWERYGKGR